MVEDLLFVSCDIVGHSTEPDVTVQLRHAQAINDIVKKAIASGTPNQTSWFSAGDGGHVALGGNRGPERAVQLLIDLREWSRHAGVPLRIAACAGQVGRFVGADGRIDMVGPGLNLATRLLQHAAPGRTVVTDEFRLRCEATTPDAQFHAPRVLRVWLPEPRTVWLFSAKDRFVSAWNDLDTAGIAATEDDRSKLRHASAHRDGLTTLYRAKRLLQTNAADGDALRAIRHQMGPDAGRISSSSMLAQLFADPSLGQEFLRAAILVERSAGDVLCHAGDSGRTMFLVLRGRLAGFLPSQATGGVPDFELGPGDLVGEMAFALRAARTATLVCVEDCSLLAISQQELFAAASGSPLLPQVKQVVDSIVCARIVQNMCRTVAYLSGPSRTGPLGKIEKPWLDLGPYCRTIHIAWQDRDLRFDGPDFREPGLYVLAGGKLETAPGAVIQAEGAEPPILVAEFPGELRYRAGVCRLLDDVTILSVRPAGFEQFGPSIYRQLTTEIRARTAGGGRLHAERLPVEGLLRIGGDTHQTHGVDVVFVHGLDGDARGTWHPKDDPTLFWPSWLAEDVPGVTVWSLGYAVSSSAWRGTDMPLADRATNALAMLEAAGFGERPVLFVCHSLGGLLVKQMLRHSVDYGVPSWGAIARQTRGIVFLSTPHSGSDISNWLKYLGLVLRLTTSVDELKAHDPRLRELNTWFRNSPLVADIAIQVYCEKQSVAGLLVVNETSADPGLKGVIPVPLDENHVSICKPESREKLVYSRIRRFVADIALAAT